MKKSILRLSELAKEISEVFRKNFSSERYWVSAEILGLKINKGHCYLQLGEKDERSTQPKAEFKAMVWASNFTMVHARFVAETGNELQENMEVLCLVEVQFHERFGMSLLIHDIDPAYTLGRMAIERKKTVDQLKKEGVYLLNKQQHLPVVVQNIAIISSADADGFKDFTTKLFNNHANIVFHWKLFPSLMQGDNAPASIINALHQIKNHSCFPYLHAVVIVRGGGQTSSLSCYNDYQLAFEVANFPIPVLTGIGHTADISIVDEVAHLNLITPTAVADFIIQHAAEFTNQLNYLRDGIHAYANLGIDSEEEIIVELAEAIANIVNESLLEEQHYFESAASVMNRLVKDKILNESNTLFYKKEKIKLLVDAVILKNKNQLLFNYTELKNKSRLILNKEENDLNNAQIKSEILDPMNILKRGFSYTLYNNQLVFDPDEVPLNAELETIVLKGKIKSKKMN
ncbi:MAG: exodeoxyribonuclease VII large subunit [Bacteroidota bacterium]